MTYIIAVSNEKGGVAKTTTALSLGGALTDLGKRVLMIDLDAQANLTIALGIPPSRVSLGAHDILLSSIALQDCIQPSPIQHLDIIPSNNKAELARQLLPVYINYTERLKNAFIDAFPLPYEYVIIDCPPALDAITRNALTSAHLLLIPTQAEFFSTYALRNMMQMIQTIRQESNPYLAYRILVTLYDRRNRSHREIYTQLKNTFKDGLFKTIIEVDTRLRESPITGVPITHYTPKSRGARQYRQLAEELISYVAQKEKTAGK